MFPVPVDSEKLILNNFNKFDEYYLNRTKSLNKYAPQMPIIIDEDLNLINGIGRLYNIAEKVNCPKTIECIMLPNDISEFAYYMLNYVTMDFNIHNKYKKELRYNSYKRSRNKSTMIGDGYIVKLVKRTSAVNNTFSENLKQKFIQEYGNYILDFGAGHLRNADILNKNGIYCVPFEPFVIDADKFETLSFERSYNCCNNFLEEFQKNDEFSTIFLHAVFNSVPFEEDRKKILTILSSIATDQTKIIIWTRHVSSYHERVNTILNKDNKTTFKNMEFLDYEDNITISDLENHPKVQKFYDEKSLIKLCKPFFKTIRTTVKKTYIYAELTHPIKQPLNKLDEAIDFEFNLEHPNGKTLGLNKKAKKIFHEIISKRGEHYER